jgi:hypothetical protein
MTIAPFSQPVAGQQGLAEGGRLELHPRDHPGLALVMRSRHLGASPSVPADSTTAVGAGLHSRYGIARFRSNGAATTGSVRDRTASVSRLEAEELAIDEHDTPAPLSEDDIRALQAQVGDVVRHGDARPRKALLQALVHEIREVGRNEIQPTFALPAVRPRAGSVPPGGIEPPLPA